MKINYSDALLIQSIFHSEQENQGAKLSDIIAYADYVDHAIMSFEEFSEGLNKLFTLNLITITAEDLATTETFKEWWNLKFTNRKRIYAQNELEQIQSYLSKLSKASSDFSTEIRQSEMLSENNFRKASNEYTSKTDSVVKDLLQKLKSKKPKG